MGKFSHFPIPSHPHSFLFSYQAELGEQVDLLKELSKDIHQEVRSQNQMLDGMVSC